MIEYLLQPFNYNYMVKAILVSTIVGATCAFLSAYLILNGWSLMGDALSHSVLPGVAIAYALGMPCAVGAFCSGILAALAMALVRHFSCLREDAIIGFIFSTFFAIGLLIISLHPTSVNMQSIVLGNILSITDTDIRQVEIIISISMLILILLWRDLLIIFFDENHSVSIGLEPLRFKILFFILLSACTVAAMKTVGAILVISMLITPGATAYLLTDRFSWLLLIATFIGSVTSGFGSYLSFFLDGATGSLIVIFQTLVFLVTFFSAPKHGVLASKRRAFNRFL